MDKGTLNLIIALARAANIRPELLATLFNERKENQQFFDELLVRQQATDREDIINAN